NVHHAVRYRTVADHRRYSPHPAPRHGQDRRLCAHAPAAPGYQVWPVGEAGAYLDSGRGPRPRPAEYWRGEAAPGARRPHRDPVCQPHGPPCARSPQGPRIASMSAANRRKGKTDEREIRDYLRAEGHEYDQLRLHGSTDEGDGVIRLPGGRVIIIEAKI